MLQNEQLSRLHLHTTSVIGNSFTRRVLETFDDRKFRTVDMFHTGINTYLDTK